MAGEIGKAGNDWPGDGLIVERDIIVMITYPKAVMEKRNSH